MSWWLEEQRLAFELGEVEEVGEEGEVGEVGEEAGPRDDAKRKPSSGAKRSWSPAAATRTAPSTETVGAVQDGFRFDFAGPAGEREV